MLGAEFGSVGGADVCIAEGRGLDVEWGVCLDATGGGGFATGGGGGLIIGGG